jgi:diketogulonate reductase-like aldo/keto reductase
LIGAGLAGALLPIDASLGKGAAESSSTMRTRLVPSSGEKLPVIGLGTWKVFDVGSSESERAPLAEVLRLFLKMGGRVIDSSPMYGRSEQVIGDLTAKLGIGEKLFLATKVWTSGKQAGIESMERSFVRLQTRQIDLMQVHNLVDIATQLATMREWKAQGRFRYIGITHYESSAFAEVEKVLQKEKLDFVQINFSIMEREAEQKILPLALDRGVAVIVNRPFGGGDLFSRVKTKQLPAGAADFDCHSWAQFFLKWILGHPAVTCAIPATNNPKHLEDNMQAGMGPLPDAKTRQRMAEYVSAL